MLKFRQVFERNFLFFKQMCLNEIDVYCLQACKRKSYAVLGSDSLRQLLDACLLRLQLRVQVEFALPQGLLAPPPAVAATHQMGPDKKGSRRSLVVSRPLILGLGRATS